MKKAASTSSLLLLWVLATGCQSQSTQARVHLRVFEVTTQALQLQVSERHLHKLSDSAYSVSVVTPGDLDILLQSSGSKQPLLTERTRVIDGWPAIADTWAYSPNYTGMGQYSICIGGGVGSLGVRQHGRNLEVRLDYTVDHRGPQGQMLIESKLFYDHDYPEGRVLLFHTPAHEPDGSSRQHVIAFEITRQDQRSTFEATESRRQPPEILAYR
jgi:hypothetical protein